MEMKHTPGPWKCIKREHEIFSREKFDIENESGQMCIAMVHNFDTDEKNKANAKLIRAAPDLLDALKYYFDVLNEVRGNDWDKKPDHVLTKMLDAFKKATE